MPKNHYLCTDRTNQCQVPVGSGNSADTFIARQIRFLNSHLALTMARKAAISYGEVLSNEEMDTLVNHLFACSDVNHTPDGKTILSILPQQNIERLMG